MLAADDGTEAVADQVQRVVVLAVPFLRVVARGARFTRVPWVLVASTAFSVGSAVRSGVHEVQVIGSLWPTDWRRPRAALPTPPW